MNTDAIYQAEEAIRQLPGSPEYKLVLLENHEDNIVLRQGGEVEKMLRATSLSLAVNLLIDGRDGFFYTNCLRRDFIPDFIRKAYATTLLLQPDENRTLADPSRYYKGGGIDLRNYDDTLCEADAAVKMELVLAANAEAEGADPRIISVQTRYADRQHNARYLISNGFEGTEQCSHCTLASIVTVEGESGQHPMDGWGASRLFLNQMPHTGIGTTALRRALRKIGARPAPSGRYRMIVESPVASSFLQPILNAMGGQALQGRTSFLLDKLGTNIMSPLANLVDAPLIPGTRGATHFDFDGVRTERRLLITDGQLRTYFLDTAMARKLGMAPTTQGTHHLIMQPGSESLDSLIAGSRHAILVTDWVGGNCDPATGNFSYGIEGFLIEKGCVAHPVSGMNVTGNMLSVWQRLTGVANDADPWEAERIPSLAFEDVAFGGTAE